MDTEPCGEARIEMNRVTWVIVITILLFACFFFLLAGANPSGAQSKAPPKAKVPRNLTGLQGLFDLTGARIPEVRYYLQETQVVHFGFDGQQKGIKTYTVKLRCVPAALSGKNGDEYTVGEFSICTGKGEAETIPQLAGWSYILAIGSPGQDEEGQVFGIPHDRFVNLTTSRGARLTGAGGYQVYNSFIDFHAFCDVLARPTAGGAGFRIFIRSGNRLCTAPPSPSPPQSGERDQEGFVFSKRRG
jgi:hypothetical protein